MAQTNKNKNCCFVFGLGDRLLVLLLIVCRPFQVVSVLRPEEMFECVFTCGTDCKGTSLYPCLQIFVNNSESNSVALLHFDEQQLVLNPKVNNRFTVSLWLDISIGVVNTAKRWSFLKFRDFSFTTTIRWILVPQNQILKSFCSYSLLDLYLTS